MAAVYRVYTAYAYLRKSRQYIACALLHESGHPGLPPDHTFTTHARAYGSTAENAVQAAFDFLKDMHTLSYFRIEGVDVDTLPRTDRGRRVLGDVIAGAIVEG